MLSKYAKSGPDSRRLLPEYPCTTSPFSACEQWCCAVPAWLPSIASVRLVPYHTVWHELQNVVHRVSNSLEGGVEAGYELPHTTEVPQLNTYDAAAETVTSTMLVEECRRVCDILAAKTDGEIMAGAHVVTGTERILNSAGADLSTRFSSVGIHGEAIFPGTGQGIGRFHSQKGFQPLPDALIDETVYWYTQAACEVTPKGGKMKVLFMPQSMYALTWRINNGASGKSVYDGVSPIVETVN